MVVLVALVGVPVVAWAAWPEPEPPIVSDKVHPPEPLNLTGPAERCVASDLDVSLAADRTAFGPGRPVTFTVTLENTGRVPCLVDGADVSSAVTVYAAPGPEGGERVWSSADCAPADERLLLLGPGDADPPRTVRWSDVRTVPGCAGGQPELVAGDYVAQLTFADVPGAVSEPVTVTYEVPEPTPEPTPTGPAADPAATGTPPTDPAAPGAKAPTDPGTQAPGDPGTQAPVDPGARVPTEPGTKVPAPTP
ncbi:hypothetical protein [Antribacter gilvus]|uniref:hypothetical protein n=1 Tax=Antribacter gilvus TaxID=2304675 RepID=UPI000F7B362E|nr:hypothetical protein [Antribacter gilvus]